MSVCAALMLAACGGDDSVSSPTDPTLQPAVAVNIVGSGGDTAEAASTELAAQDAKASADSDRSTGLMPAFGGYVFEAGEGLPALPANSTGYHFSAGGSVDAADVSRIAAALGVDGEPQPATPDSGYQWRVGPEDGTAPALFVADDGQLSWYYSNAWATAAVEGCAVAGSEGGTAIDVGEGAVDEAVEPAFDPAVDEHVPTSDVPPDQPTPIDKCTTPEPPAGVPTADEAVAKANELLAALGEDPAAFELEKYADEWNASITAYTTVDGVRWPNGFGFGFGGEGALIWANGTLAEPVATGPYPLVDLDTAIARLSEQNGMWGYGRGDVLAVDTKAGEEAATDEVVQDPTETDMRAMPVSTDDGTNPPIAEPMVATLVDVKADLWWVWDADGSVWLLPAYTFTDTNGNAFTVPAVTDEFMIVVEPPTIEPQPEPVPAEPIDPVVVDPPTTDIAAPADPTGLEEFVGLPLGEFEEAAKGYGFTTRVTRQDGVDLPGTMDYSDTRVNVEVKGDTVVAIMSLG